MKYKTFQLKVSTIEFDYPESSPDCQSVNCTECCFLSPLLTEDELRSGKYIYTFVDVGAPIPSFGIPKTEKGNCIYFDLKDRVCTIYDDRPLGCRQFDCRVENSGNISNKFL